MTDVSNRNGGADLHGEKIDIGQDVIGRDKIISTTINNYFANIDPSYAVSDGVAAPLNPIVEDRGELKFAGDLVKDYYAQLEQLSKHQGAPIGIPTGLADLDRLSGGMQRSDLIIVAGRSSVGKTSFLLNVALKATTRFYQRVAIFSLAESNRQIIQRLLSALSGFNSQRLRLGDLNEEEWKIFVKASSVLGEASICIDDTPNLSISQLRIRARKLHAEYGLDAVFVDGLQLLTDEESLVNHEQGISGIACALKTLAKEMNVPVMVTSELNQSVDRRIDKRPCLSDFDESMLIERYADVVLLIYRDDLYDPESVRRNIAEIIVAKHRHGPIATVELFFQPDLGLYRTALQHPLK